MDGRIAGCGVVSQPTRKDHKLCEPSGFCCFILTISIWICRKCQSLFSPNAHMPREIETKTKRERREKSRLKIVQNCFQINRCRPIYECQPLNFNNFFLLLSTFPSSSMSFNFSNDEMIIIIIKQLMKLVSVSLGAQAKQPLPITYSPYYTSTHIYCAHFSCYFHFRFFVSFSFFVCTTRSLNLWYLSILSSQYAYKCWMIGE